MWHRRLTILVFSGVVGALAALVLPGSVHGGTVSRALLDERATFPIPWPP